MRYKKGSSIAVMYLLLQYFFAGPVFAVSETIAGECLHRCSSLRPPAGFIVTVSSVLELQKALKQSVTGTTILLTDGLYSLNGVSFSLKSPDITIRSVSGNRESVVLDGEYKTPEIFQIMASNITIADLTLQKASKHPIHVMSSKESDTLNTRIYNVHIIDPGEQAIKINPAADGHYTDNGEIACSHLELTTAGRSHIRNNCYTGGIDAHQSRGWVVCDNLIEGFWCPQGLSEHAIHFWRGSRDTVVERNVIRNNARGVGFGMVTSGKARLYSDDPCSTGKNYVDHYGGVVTENTITVDSVGLFESRTGADCGICIWQSCNVTVENNKFYSEDPTRTFSSIEWRFPMSNAVVRNNVVNVKMRARDGAKAVESGNSK